MLATLTLTAWLWSLTDRSLIELQALRCPSEAEWLAGDIASRAERKETRKRIWDACHAMGAAEDSCVVLDEVVIRESSGDTCAVHRLGPGENGLGPLGLSVSLHLPKWNSASDPQVLRVPEVSAVVAMRIFRRAVTNYHAKNWRAVAAVFAGRFDEDHTSKPTGDDFVFCARLQRRGVDCNAKPKLGEKLGRAPVPGQEEFVSELIAEAIF